MSSYEAWLQWMTTSSPGCHLVTPSPTFQTMPEASDPPMWWSSFGWERKTDTGLPSAAHTLLKFTPAAITRTTTSNAPGSGTSISSSWKASLGSPSRSSRITQAAIVFGSSPGSTSSADTFVTSTAMRAGRLSSDRDRLRPRSLRQGGGIVLWSRPGADQRERDHSAERRNAGRKPHAARQRVDEGVVRCLRRRGRQPAAVRRRAQPLDQPLLLCGADPGAGERVRDVAAGDVLEQSAKRRHAEGAADHPAHR